jgi:hypothetical protein
LVVQVGDWVLRSVKARPHPTLSRSWVEVPTLGSTTSDPRLKYDLEASALVIYRGDKAFVAFEDEAVPEQLLGHSDVRALSDDDARRFEESLPVPIAPPQRRTRRAGLGDLISWAARGMGLRECAGCGRRRERLNKIPVWGWWARE